MKPFSGGNRRLRWRPQEDDPRARHGLEDAAELVDLPRPGGVQHRPGRQEEKRLEEAVIPHMQQATRQAEHDQLGPSQRSPDQARPIPMKMIRCFPRCGRRAAA